MRGAGSRCATSRTSAVTWTFSIGWRRTRVRRRSARSAPAINRWRSSSLLLLRSALGVRARELFGEQRRQALLVALVQRLIELLVELPVLHLVRRAQQGAALQPAIEAFLQIARLDAIHQFV